MASDDIPVILVGCGAVAREFYLPALRSLERAGRLKVAALVDPSPAARAALARAFPGARPSADLEGAGPPPGALAIVASPPRYHAAQTLAALARGWHVLCEKPMASNAEEGERMIEAARAAGRLLAVGLYKRFFPSSRYLRALCREGLLGSLQRFSIAEGGPFRWPAASASFFDRRQASGGVLPDIGVHVFDLLGWWVEGLAPAAYADDAMGGLETNAWAEFTWKGHGAGGPARGAVRLSRDWATDQSYTFVFERGLAQWKVNDANGLTLQLAGAPAALRASLIAPIGADSRALEAAPALESNAQSFILQLDNVLAAIAGRAPLEIPGEEGLGSLRLIEQCLARRRLLAQPWLGPAEAVRAGALAGAASLP